jgi:hypothetical protein
MKLLAPKKVFVPLICLVAGVFAACAWYHWREPDVTWATEEGEWDGWKDDVVKLRAARKNQPILGALYSEKVQLDEFHDSTGFSLSDGRNFRINGTKELFDTVFNWKKGRGLVLCYEDKLGAYLFDPATSLRIPLGSITKPHPISSYIDSLDAQTTYDMMSANYEEVRLWRLEIDRIVRSVLAQERLPEDVRRDFIELTRVRVDYCRSQASVGGGALHDYYSPGTIAGPVSGFYGTSIYRDAYFHLSDVHHELLFYSLDTDEPETTR